MVQGLRRLGRSAVFRAVLLAGRVKARVDEDEGGYVDGWIAIEEELMMVDWLEWCVCGVIRRLILRRKRKPG